jgi:hypothetical protein
MTQRIVGQHQSKKKTNKMGRIHVVKMRRNEHANSDGLNFVCLFCVCVDINALEHCRCQWALVWVGNKLDQKKNQIKPISVETVKDSLIRVKIKQRKNKRRVR